MEVSHKKANQSLQVEICIFSDDSEIFVIG